MGYGGARWCWAVGLAVSCLLSKAAVGKGPSDGEWLSDLRLTRNPAASSMSINFARNLAADRFGGLHLVWSDERDGNQEIYAKRSPDGGVTWSPPRRLTDDEGASLSPSVAVAGRRVHVVWFDDREGAPAIYYKRSRDGGLSWDEAKTLTPSTSAGAHPSIAVWGPNVHVVYVDGRDGQSEVYYLKSSDSGSTWSDGRRLSDLPHNSWTPTVSVFKGWVYVAWTDTRHGAVQSHEEEYFKRSDDHGETWSSDIRLTNDPASSWAPSLAASGSDVWIAWFDDREDGWQVYVRRSRNHGATWSGVERLSSSAGGAARPSIAVRGRALDVVWFDMRHGAPEIYGRSSETRGRLWGDEVRLTDSPGESILATVAASFAGVFVAWQDARDGNTEIYFKRRPGEAIETRNGRIAFSRLVGDGPQIFTAEGDGSDERQLTSPPGWSQYPAWSRDGSRIVYTSTRSGSAELWIMDPDGSAARQLTVGTGGSFVPDVSPDGTRIAFASTFEAGIPEVWVIGADGSGASRLTFTTLNPSGFNWSLLPSWSADSARIVYSSTESGSSQIWMMMADGRGQKQKTDGLGADSPHANAPSWSPDGSRIVFWSGFEGQYGEVWTMHPDGYDRQRITETQDPRNSDNPSWAADGSSILFDTNRSGSRVELWRVGVNGASPRYLLDAFGPTSWQPQFARSKKCADAGCAKAGAGADG